MIAGMQLGVSLSEEDVEFLDDYGHEREVDSRSAALHEAIGMLRMSRLSES